MRYKTFQNKARMSQPLGGKVAAEFSPKAEIEGVIGGNALAQSMPAGGKASRGGAKVLDDHFKHQQMLIEQQERMQGKRAAAGTESSYSNTMPQKYLNEMAMKTSPIKAPAKQMFTVMPQT